MKDRFSLDSRGYANFRPGYPADLVDFVLEQTAGRSQAWDCATGNGQFASMLAPHFERVEATDISASQLAEAAVWPNVRYTQQPAEQTDFAAGSFDLITVAQAVHWFDFDRFYAEVRRVAAPGATLALIGYPLFEVELPAVDVLIRHFYEHTIHPFWDAERRHLDARYATIPFPFAEVACPAFEMAYDWNFEQLMGYLGTWSAVKNCRRETGTDPLVALENTLREAWGDLAVVQVRFPMILKMGTV